MPVLPKGYKKCRKNRETGAIFPAKSGWPDTKNFIYGYKDPTGAFHEGKLKRGVSPIPKISSPEKDKKVKVRVATYIAEVDSATAAKWKVSPVQSTTINTSGKDLANVLVDTIDKIIKDRENSLRVRLRLEMLDALNAALSKVFGGMANQEVKPV